MDIIAFEKEKIVLKFSEDDLALLCNALNEVCHGIKVPEFNSSIGMSRKDASIILDFLSSSCENVEKFRLDKLKD